MQVVVGTLTRWIRGVVGRLAERVDAALRTASRPVSLVGGLLRDLTRSPEEFLAENTALRQQLLVVARATKKPKFTPHERGLLVVLARLMPRWPDAMLLVKPETILRWHREGLRLFWRVRSRPPALSVPRISSETIDLMRRLADENALWGAERIHVAVTRNPSTT